MTPERRHFVLFFTPSPPKCFDSPHQWQEYVLMAAEASHGADPAMMPLKKVGDRTVWNSGFDFCRDCHKSYAAQMARAKRCEKQPAEAVDRINLRSLQSA